MELLYTFLECSIAILAFASIVAQFKKSKSSQWNLHQYQGIITHSVQAFFYSCLPLLLKAFPISENNLWTTCTSVLGIITILQATGVMFADKVTKPITKIVMFSFSFLVLLLQLSHIVGFVNSGIAVYNVGIFWHLFQSIYLIATFILNAETDEQIRE